jgi:hypothetical protein
MQKTLEKFETKSFSKPDETRPFEKGKAELVTLGGKVVGRATFEPGWRWSTCVKPIAKTASCESAHFGYQLSGTMKVKMDDGQERTIKAGEAFEIPPGHDAWVEGNETVVCVDFQGLSDYAKKR